jgi:hypothetical protein
VPTFPSSLNFSGPSPASFRSPVSGTSALYIGIVCVISAIILYTLTCTILYFWVKSVSGRYTVTRHYSLGNDESISSTSVIPGWLECLNTVWKVGTCYCCSCLARLCLNMANQTARIGRSKYF